MSQLIDLGKLRFHFAGEWVNSTTYESNDIVKYGGNVYVYTYALKTGGNLPTDTAYWALMVEGFKFKGVFNPATAYHVGDGIAYGGKVYVAVLDGTGIIPPNTTYWSQFADGIQYEGTYSNATAYQKNDVVLYGGSVYIAKQDSVANDPTVTAYWDKFVEGISAKGVYNNATAYVPGDMSAYGPNIYRAKVNTTGNVPTSTTQWELFVSGSKYQGIYNAATTYYLNDIVTYGSNTYRSKQTQAATLPTTSASWELLTQGFSYQGVWSSGTAYTIGQVITYGGSLFQAIVDNQATNPVTTATWNKLVYGFRNRGDWTTSTQYGIDEVVVYGGNTYISLIPHASTTFASDLIANNWLKFNSGIRWRGVWAAATTYLKDDIIKDAVGSAYIALSDHTSNLSFNADLSTAKWTVFVVGGANVLPVIQTGDVGQSLTVKGDGAGIDWIGASESANVYWVAPHGVDGPNYGKNLSTPFASVKYAAQNCGVNATIFVKTGTYNEQLPIIIPENTAIVGDSQRTVIIQAKAGLSDDGVTTNANASMFLMSNGSILNKLTFKGMTGWVPGSTTNDITTSVIKGVVVRLNPASPITTKSPYVLECAAIGAGLIGALVDGSTHSVGAKTMIFHGFTVITDNGVGYWVKDGGKAEIVSCFTYYAYFGYASTGGGHIRALNGNNSYGTWGASSRGYDMGEIPVTGNIYGQQLNFIYQGGNINVGDTVTSSSGATAIVTNVQTSADKVYVKNATGTFTSGNTLTFTSSGIGTVKSGALENQKGFILVLNNLTSQPVPGQSISITGDSYAYVVQSIQGSWSDSTSVLAVVLAQEKPNSSSTGTAITLRSKYSQIRLTGHDFLSIGTGGVITTNYPGIPTQPSAQGNEVDEAYPGRVYYVSTDQDGNFRVGEYFRIDQATGRATLNASAFDLAGLTSLKLGSIGAQLGETINEFSSDGTLSGNSNMAVPTEYAVKTYVDAKSVSSGTAKVSKTGDTMTGILTLSGAPIANLDAATKIYVDTTAASVSTASSIYKLSSLDTTANTVVELDSVAYFTTNTAISQTCQVDGILMVIETTTGDTLQAISLSPSVDTTLTGSFLATKQQYSIPTWATITVGTTSTVNIVDIPRTYLL